MKESREVIIELVEPYMEKTLKQFCVIKSHKWLGYFIFLNNFNEIEYVNNSKHFCVEKNKCEIIGHYDITAVLKYIRNMPLISNYHITDDFIQFGKSARDDNWNFYDYQVWEIPNKPLNLYTEQEEKELLELLVKLNKWEI